jgi:hypothetical protein
MIYGYASVSTDGQSVAAQVAQLTDAGAATTFRETASGAKTDRREMSRAIKALEAGDTLLLRRWIIRTQDTMRAIRACYNPWVVANLTRNRCCFCIDGSTQRC